jgi:WD40 repeat protein
VSDLNSEQHSFLFHQKQWNYDTDDDVDIDIDIDDIDDDDDDDDANNVLFPQSPAKTPHRSPMLLSATPPPPITVSISQSRSSNKDTHQLIKTPPQNQFQHRLTPIERDFSLTSTSQKMHSQSQHSPQFSLSMNESEQFPPILITTPHHGYKFDPSTVVGSSLNRSNETNQFSSQSLTSTNPSSNYSNQQPSSGSLQLDRSNESINSILNIIDGAKSHNYPSVEVHHLGQNEFTPQDNTTCSLQPPDISTTTNTAAVTMPYQYSTRSQINTTFQTSTTLYNAQVTKNSQFIPYHHIIPQIDLLIRNQPYSDHVEEEKSNQLKRLLCDLTRLELVKMCEGVKNIIPTDSIAQTILPQILSISDTILDSDNLISLYSFLHKLQTFPNNANYLPHGKEIVESNQKSVFEVNLQHWYNINQNTFERFLQDNQPAVNKTHLPTQTLQTNQPILLSIPNILQPSSSLRLGHVANPTQSLLSNSLLFRPNCSQTITDRSKNIIQQPRSRNGSIPTPQRPIPIVDVTALNPPPPQPSPPQPPPQPPLPIQHQEPISFPIIDIPPLSAQLLHSRRSTNSIPLFSTAAQIRDGSLPTPIHFEPPPTGLFTRDSTPIEFPSASPPQSITLPSTNLSANRTTRGLFTLNRRDRRSTNIPNNTENIYSSHHGTNISNNSHHYQRERSILYLVDDLKDDYYCSILDWGKNNIVALGLCNGIKLFNMNTVAVPYNHNGIPKSSSLRLPYSLFGPSLSSSQLQSSQRNNLRQYYSIIQGNIPLHFSNNPTLARLYYAEQNCLVYDSPHRNFERVLHHPTLFQPKHFSTRSIKKQAQLIHSSPFEITSLVWCNDNIIATGTKNGDIFLFDIEAEKLRQVYLKQHEGRIGSLSFCGSQNISNEEITSAHPTMQVDKYTIIEPNQQTEGDKEGGNYLKGGHRINSLGLINDEVWGQLSYNLENDNNNDDNENRNNNINTKQSAFSHIPSPQQVYINRHKQRQQAINANRMTTNTFQQSLQLLASGGRDGNIKLFDTRLPHSILSITDHHTQEVVGLKWSPNGLALASGSNDSTVGIWDVFGQTKKYRQHTAAIRALAWSPFQDYLLATGGGTQDKTICLWDVRYDYNHQARLHSSFSQYNLNNLPPAKGSLLSNIPSALVSQVHTGNQVCNLAWGKQYNELIVAFGFSQNMISFYDIPSLCPLNVIGDGHYVESRDILLEPTPRQYSVDTLLGTTPRKHHHVFTHRVNTSCQNNLTGFGSRPLHLVLSPTGHYLASAAGDKILRIVQIAK